MPAPNNFHEIPRPSGTISRQNRLKDGNLDESTLSRLWRPRRGSMMEQVISTLSRFSLRLIDRTTGDAYSADELEAKILDQVGGGVGAVRYDAAQSLTDPQKAQARENIGADASATALTFAGSKPNGVYATCALTFTQQPVDGDTVTIGAVTYIFGSDPTDIPIGGTINETLQNLGDYMDGAGIPDVPLHPTARSSTLVGNVLTVVAIDVGTAGNSIGTSTSVTGSSWASGAFTGGLAALAATHLGQWCKASTAWWQWSGAAWIPIRLLTGEPITTDGTNYYAITHDGSALNYAPFP